MLHRSLHRQVRSGTHVPGHRHKWEYNIYRTPDSFTEHGSGLISRTSQWRPPFSFAVVGELLLLLESIQFQNDSLRGFHQTRPPTLHSPCSLAVSVLLYTIQESFILTPLLSASWGGRLLNPSIYWIPHQPLARRKEPGTLAISAGYFERVNLPGLSSVLKVFLLPIAVHTPATCSNSCPLEFNHLPPTVFTRGTNSVPISLMFVTWTSPFLAEHSVTVILRVRYYTRYMHQVQVRLDMQMLSGRRFAIVKQLLAGWTPRGTCCSFIWARRF